MAGFTPPSRRPRRAAPRPLAARKAHLLSLQTWRLLSRISHLARTTCGRGQGFTCRRSRHRQRVRLILRGVHQAAHVPCVYRCRRRLRLVVALRTRRVAEPVGLVASPTGCPPPDTSQPPCDRMGRGNQLTKACPYLRPGALAGCGGERWACAHAVVSPAKKAASPFFVPPTSAAVVVVRSGAFAATSAGAVSPPPPPADPAHDTEPSAGASSAPASAISPSSSASSSSSVSASAASFAGDDRSEPAPSSSCAAGDPAVALSSRSRGRTAAAFRSSIAQR